MTALHPESIITAVKYGGGAVNMIYFFKQREENWLDLIGNEQSYLEWWILLKVIYYASLTNKNRSLSSTNMFIKLFAENNFLIIIF